MKGAVSMKKFICLAAVVLIVFSFYSCKKETEQPSTETSSKAEASSSDSIKPVSDNENSTTSESADKTELCSVSRKDSVEVYFLDEADGSVSRRAALNAADSYVVNKVLSDYEFTVNPYDNMNDMLIKINGRRYAYDSDSGIFTYSDENTPVNQEQTVKLNTSDLKHLNRIFFKYENRIDGIAGDKFIVKEINSTLLTMAKWDNAAGELKEGLYCGDYGKVENAESMNIKVGDIITVYYETPYAETYPYQINITDIVLAGQ